MPDPPPVLSPVEMLRLLSALQGQLVSQIATRPAAAESEPRQLVTLDQIGGLVHRKKRTMERYRKRLGRPAIRGGGGRPSLWDYAEVRERLQELFGLSLPLRFPTL